MTNSKLILAYIGWTLVLLAIGNKITLATGLILTGAFVLLLGVFSVRHRMASGWRWPGVTPRNILHAVLTLVLGGLFAFAVNPLFPITNPSVRPWYLGLAGVVLFNVLRALQILEASETGFQEKCPAKSVPQVTPGIYTPTRPNRDRKTMIKSVYSGFFLLVWLIGLASFYFFGVALKNGSPIPTTSQTESLSDHGRVVYVTPIEELVVDLLVNGMAVGIFVVIVLGFLLQKYFGIKLFPERRKRPDDDEPTMWDRWETRGKD